MNPVARYILSAASAIATACVLGCSTPQSAISAGQCDSSVAANREMTLAFYRLALVEKKPREAFERYASTTMVEHKAVVPGGTRTAVVEFLEQLIADLPNAKWEVLRIAADADLVFLHARFVTQPAGQEYAIADIFRIESCKIVEHWDVVEELRDGQPNPHSRF